MRFVVLIALAILLVANTVAGFGLAAVAAIAFEGTLLDGSVAEEVTIGIQTALLAAVSLLNVAVLGMDDHARKLVLNLAAIACNVLACTALAFLVVRGAAQEMSVLLVFYTMNAVGLWFVDRNRAAASAME